MRRVTPVLSVILIIVVWQLIVSISSFPSFILPSPVSVATSFILNFELICFHASITLLEVFVGLVIGISLGICTAILLATSTIARAFLKPTLVFSQALPVFALAPILTLWLGYGLWSKIAMAVFFETWDFITDSYRVIQHP